MVESGGDKKKLGLEKSEMPTLAVSDSLSGGRRMLAKGTPTDQYILNNFHCCHLNVKDKKIYLYTATTTDTIPFSGYNLDWSQTFWAQSEWAPFYKAMIIPPYPYLIGENRDSYVFDKVVNKNTLGKKREGWNLGYQCMAGIGVYRNQLGSMTINSVPITVSQNQPNENLESCLKVC